MTEEQFWEIIEESRRARMPDEGKEANQERQLEGLKVALQRLTPEEILQFEDVFGEMLDRSYRWDLWALPYLIDGWCSDDGFDYFRSWLISQGRFFFESVIGDPDTIAAMVSDAEIKHGLEFEEFWYVAGEVYKEKTGEDIWDVETGSEDTPPAGREGPAGERWTLEDLPVRFPRTWARFGGEEEE